MDITLATSLGTFVWTITGSPTNGTYCNGDPWVVGPITVTAISPTPGANQNGAMLSPIVDSDHGFDGNVGNGFAVYDADNNVALALPLVIAANNTLVSCISLDAYQSLTAITRYGYLTVVASPPAAGSFRPTPYGVGSRANAITNGVNVGEADMNYAVFASHDRTPLTAAPDLEDITERFAHPWFHPYTGFENRFLHPAYMADNGYGKDLAHNSGDAALVLNLDYTNAEKRDLLVGYVQAGLDAYGYLQRGGAFYADGGHNCGWLLPVAIAGQVLGNSDLLAAITGTAQLFQEIQQTFFVLPSDVALSHISAPSSGNPIANYDAADLGKPEWGIRHRTHPTWDCDVWHAAYRDIGGSTMTVAAQVLETMGMREAVDWEPLFDYAERHLNYEYSAEYGGEFGFNPTPTFHVQFAEEYSGVLSTSPQAAVLSLTAGTYESGRVVTATSATAGSSLYYTTNGDTPTAASTLYTGAITLTASITLKVVVIHPDHEIHPVTSAAYTIDSSGRPAPVSNLTVSIP